MKPPKFHRDFDYNRELLPNAHLAALEAGVKTIDEATPRTGFTIGYPGWGVLYHVLLSHLDPTRENILVETGTNWGCSTIIMAQALKDSGCVGRVISIEINAENHCRALDNVNKAGIIDRVELINNDSKTALPDIVARVPEIRAALLDSSHLSSDVVFEFETIYPKLGDQSLVFFDNTYLIADPGEDQRVNGALKYLHNRYHGQLINLEYASWYTPGLALWQRRPFSRDSDTV